MILMANKFIDIINRIIKYNEISVHIAFHNQTAEPFFKNRSDCISEEKRKKHKMAWKCIIMKQ
jgi:hypothetical protein